MKLKYISPSRDEAEYQAVLKAGFEAYPEREVNFLKYKNHKQGDEIDFAPFMFDIENTRKCNFKCRMCHQADLMKTDDLSIEVFRELVGSMTCLTEVKIQGMGEPFLDKNYIEMIKAARAMHLWVRSTTNASLLHKNENYKKIIDADISELQISIDGCTKETYTGIRNGADFERVAENCKLINGYCDSIKKDKTRMWSLIQAENFGELMSFPEFASELGFKRLTLAFEIGGWGDDSWNEVNKVKNVSEALTQSTVDELIEKGKELGVEVTFYGLDSGYSFKEGRLCPWPFSRAYISAEGEVVPCCTIANPEILSMGKLADFESLWNGEVYKKFRDAHLSGNIPAVCRNCYID